MMPQLVGDWGTPVPGSYKAAAALIGPDVEVLLLVYSYTTIPNPPGTYYIGPSVPGGLGYDSTK